MTLLRVLEENAESLGVFWLAEALEGGLVALTKGRWLEERLHGLSSEASAKAVIELAEETLVHQATAAALANRCCSHEFGIARFLL
jgi:hypothetical protein